MAYKDLLTQSSLWQSFKNYRAEGKFLARTKYYKQKINEQGISYSEEEVIQKLAKQHPGKPRKIGDVHTYAIIPGYSWHWALFPGLSTLGKVSRFDFLDHGLNCKKAIFKRPEEWISLRESVNNELLRHLKKVHLEHPIDWVFVYTEGRHLMKETLRMIRSDLGIPVVMMCLDDKHSWEGKQLGGQYNGQIDLVAETDLYWTSSRACCEWILAEGGNAIFMPEGCDGTIFKPIEIEKEFDVVFIGGAYGFRKNFVQRLKKKFGIRIKCFGEGWEKDKPGLRGEEIVKVLNLGWINLGHGGLGYSEEFINLKTRDFEAPVIGTAAYLTSYNPDLNRCYNFGDEIFCYHSDIDLADQVHYLMANKNKIVASARSSRERCMKEHQWIHRYIRLLNILNILNEPTRDKSYY